MANYPSDPGYRRAEPVEPDAERKSLAASAARRTGTAAHLQAPATLRWRGGGPTGHRDEGGCATQP